MENRETTMYCGINREEKTKARYMDFYENQFGVLMCGIEIEDILRVNVKETEEKEDKSTYYGWWDYREKKFLFVYPTYIQVTMCFIYEMKAYEKEGIILPVEIIPSPEM